MAGYWRKENTRYETERLLTKHFSSVHARPLGTIRGGEVAEIVDRLKPFEGKHALTVAKTFFRWCAGREYISRNPLAHLPQKQSGTPRERVLSEDELRAV